MRLATITLWRLRVPLTRAYRVALADIRHFDTILVETKDAHGVHGYGEATVLTGYTQETIAQSWARACTLAESVVGLDTRSAKALIGRSQPGNALCVYGARHSHRDDGELACGWLVRASCPYRWLGILHGQKTGAARRGGRALAKPRLSRVQGQGRVRLAA